MNTKEAKDLKDREQQELEQNANLSKAKEGQNKKAYVAPKLSYEGEWDTVTMGIGVSVPTTPTR